jgi:hypothetical protein
VIFFLKMNTYRLYITMLLREHTIDLFRIDPRQSVGETLLFAECIDTCRRAFREEKENINHPIAHIMTRFVHRVRKMLKGHLSNDTNVAEAIVMIDKCPDTQVNIAEHPDITHNYLFRIADVLRIYALSTREKNSRMRECGADANPQDPKKPRLRLSNLSITSVPL